MAANFAEHRVQHTLRYKKEGDYGKERPYAIPVFYEEASKIFPGTCLKCLYGDKYNGYHTFDCTASADRK